MAHLSRWRHHEGSSWSKQLWTRGLDELQRNIAIRTDAVNAPKTRARLSQYVELNSTDWQRAPSAVLARSALHVRLFFSRDIHRIVLVLCYKKILTWTITITRVCSWGNWMRCYTACRRVDTEQFILQSSASKKYALKCLYKSHHQCNV